MQKKAKRVRHEKEKEYMLALQGTGTEIGMYVGNGLGDSHNDQVLALDKSRVLSLSNSSALSDLQIEENVAASEYYIYMIVRLQV